MVWHLLKADNSRQYLQSSLAKKSVYFKKIREIKWR